MPVTLYAFTHLDRSFKKGEVVADDDPLVELAPHLFPAVELDELEPLEPVRIRGPLTDPPKESNKKVEVV